MQLAAAAAVVALGSQTSSAWICASVHLAVMSAVALLSALAILPAVVASDVAHRSGATPISLPLLIALRHFCTACRTSLNTLPPSFAIVFWQLYVAESVIGPVVPPNSTSINEPTPGV